MEALMRAAKQHVLPVGFKNSPYMSPKHAAEKDIGVKHKATL
jgi:hypothetical protein